MSSDIAKHDEVIESIRTVQSTLDQLILREIDSAFDAIGDALITQNEQTRVIRLNYAEENLLRNTSLDSSLTTGNYKNIYLITLAHYGLAFVCSLRGDRVIAAKHLIRCYKFDSHVSRTELTPMLFEKFFKPKCSDIFEWYQRRLEAISRNPCAVRVMGGKAVAAAAFVGALAAGLAFGQLGAAHAGRREAQQMWNNSTASRYQLKDRDNAYTQLELKVDNRCREIALELLSE